MGKCDFYSILFIFGGRERVISVVICVRGRMGDLSPHHDADTTGLGMHPDETARLHRVRTVIPRSDEVQNLQKIG